MTEVTIGAARITRIEESYLPFRTGPAFFPDWQPEVVDRHRDWMIPAHYEAASGMLMLSIHSWLIRIGGRTILIDTCIGNHKPRPGAPAWHMLETPYLERLKSAGVRPEEIDVVMCTHLHIDHVGWNTRLDNGRWVPTFPNARYVFSRADWEHYKAVDANPETGPAGRGSFRDSVVPIVEAGLADMVDGAHTIDEHLAIDPYPGHTPGTIAINLASRGDRALFSGDILHHAVQMFHPEWNSVACLDASGARRSRRRALEHCAGSGALLMPGHFGTPFCCRVDSRGDGFAPRF